MSNRVTLSLDRKLPDPGQLLAQQLVHQLGDGSPLLERHLIQDLADIELQTHELNVRD